MLTACRSFLKIRHTHSFVFFRWFTKGAGTLRGAVRILFCLRFCFCSCVAVVVRYACVVAVGCAVQFRINEVRVKDVFSFVCLSVPRWRLILSICCFSPLWLFSPLIDCEFYLRVDFFGNLESDWVGFFNERNYKVVWDHTVVEGGGERSFTGIFCVFFRLRSCLCSFRRRTCAHTPQVSGHILANTACSDVCSKLNGLCSANQRVEDHFALDVKNLRTINWLFLFVLASLYCIFCHDLVVVLVGSVVY